MTNPVFKYVIQTVDESAAAVKSVVGNIFSMKGALAGLAAGAAAVTAAAALATKAWVDKTQELLKSDDALQKTALRLGTTTEKLSEFQHVADQSGVAFEQVVNSIKAQAEKLNEALRGQGEGIFYFKQMKLDIAALLAIDPVEAMSKIAEELNKIPNPAQRGAAAMKIWGESGINMLQIASNGAEGVRKLREEAHKLGIVLDQDLADAAAAVNDSLDRISKMIDGAFSSAVRESYDDLFRLTKLLEKILPPALKKATEILSETVTWLTYMGVATVNTVQALHAFKTWTDGFSLKGASEESRDFNIMLSDLRNSLMSLLVQTDMPKIQEEIKKTWEVLKPPETTGPTLADEIKKLFDEMTNADPSVQLSKIYTLVSQARKELSDLYSPQQFDALLEFFEKKLAASINAVTEQLTGFQLKMQEIATSTTAQVFDGIEEFVVRPSKKAFGEMAESFGDMLKRMAIKIALAKLGEVLANSLNKSGASGGGSGSGWWGSFVNIASAAVSAYAGSAATASTAAAGGGGGGGSFKMADGSGGGGGGVTFIYNIDARGADATVDGRMRGLLMETKNAAVAEVEQRLRQGKFYIPRASLA